MPAAPPVAGIACHQNNCILKLAMPIRRGTAVIVVGMAAILLLALIFVVPVLMCPKCCTVLANEQVVECGSLPAPGHFLSPRKNWKASRNRTAGTNLFSCNDTY